MKKIKQTYRMRAYELYLIMALMLCVGVTIGALITINQVMHQTADLLRNFGLEDEIVKRIIEKVTTGR